MVTGPSARPRLVPFTEMELVPGLRQGFCSAAVALAAGLAFGAFMALADATVLRPWVPAVQHRMLATMSLGERLAWFLPGALKDEIVLRFAAFWPLLWLVACLRGRADRFGAAVAIVLVAFVAFPLSAAGYFQALAWNGGTVLREVVLHGGAGLLWGWLSWRHGWTAGAIGHCAAHLPLQFLLQVLPALAN